MLKKIAIGVAVLVVVVGLGLTYLWTNLDSYIKTAIEKYGTEATQTTVSLDSVKLSVSSGDGILSGLTVSNPKGFTSGVKAFYLGSIEVKVDTSSIEGTAPVHILDVTIDKPQVNYEITTAGDSNLSAIQKNAQNYAEALHGKNPKAPATAAPPGDEKPARKVIIDNLYIRNGQIGISTEMLKNQNFTAPLSEIHLTNIGKSSGGATAAEVADQLLSSLTSNVGKVATGEIAKHLAGVADLDTLKGAAKDSTTVIQKQMKGIFGN